MPIRPRNQTWIALTLAAIFSLLAYIQFDSSRAFAGASTGDGESLVLLPLEPPIHILRQYVQPNSDYSAGHRGIDLQAFDGQPVFSPAPGVVRFSGQVAGRSVLTVDSADGFRWEVEPVCAKGLGIGSRVNSGDYLGEVCFQETVLASPSHCQLNDCLHLSVRRQTSAAQWRYLSPLAVIGALAPSRLKPWDAQIDSPA